MFCSSCFPIQFTEKTRRCCSTVGNVTVHYALLSSHNIVAHMFHWLVTFKIESDLLFLNIKWANYVHWTSINLQNCWINSTGTVYMLVKSWNICYLGEKKKGQICWAFLFFNLIVVQHYVHITFACRSVLNCFALFFCFPFCPTGWTYSPTLKFTYTGRVLLK